jgi:hypothetical protein
MRNYSTMTNKHIPRKLGITMTVALLLITSTFLVGQVTKPAHATQSINVYVGYADSLRPASASFPTPWVGSPNINFQGVTTGPWDNGAVRIDNPTLSPITVDYVTIDLPGPAGVCGPAGCRPVHFDLWTHNLVIPPHTGTIFSCTGNCSTSAITALDTSDYGPNSCNVPLAAGDRDPIITISIGGVPQTYDDSGHVLDTGGFDLACLHNESTPWTLIGSAPIDYSEQLLVGGLPLTGPVNIGTNVTEVASSTDITIDNFVFHWKNPSNTEVRTQSSTVNTDSYVPTTSGNWNVCVDFMSGTTLKKNVCSPFKVIQPTLTVIKKIVNDDGGNLTIAGVTLKVNGTTVINGTANPENIGTYFVSENAIKGYAATFGGDCDSTGKVVLAPGDNKTCTITNDDIKPTLTVIKKIVNDGGGTLTIAGVTLKVNGTTVINGTANPENIGTYFVSENPIKHYTATFSGDCNSTESKDHEKSGDDEKFGDDKKSGDDEKFGDDIKSGDYKKSGDNDSEKHEQLSGKVVLGIGDNKVCIITNHFKKDHDDKNEHGDDKGHE